MSSLSRSYYHGLPGLGAVGQDGKAGKQGLSIRFGYIEDFFDKEIITIDEFARYASSKNSYYEGKLNQYISDYSSYIVKGEVYNSPNAALAIQAIKIAEEDRDLVIPTTFSSSLSNVGDVLYILEDTKEGTSIRYMMIVEEGMYKTPFSSILKTYVIAADPTIIRSLYEVKDRMVISEMFSPIRYELSASIDDAIKEKYIKNFIKASTSNDYVRIAAEYSIDDTANLERLDSPNNFSEVQYEAGSFKLKSPKIKSPALYLDQSCISDVPLSKVNIPSNLILYNDSFIKGLSEDMFDPNTGNINIKISDFFLYLDGSKDYIYGALISNLDDEISKISEYSFSSTKGQINLMNLGKEGTNRFKVTFYVGKIGSTIFYSNQSSITFEKKYLDKFDKHIISSYSIEEGDIFSSDEMQTGDTDYIDFTLGKVTPEASENVIFCIDGREGQYIESISFNSIPVFANSKDSIEYFSSDEKWIKINEVETVGNSKTYSLSFKNNFPNIDGQDPKTYVEYYSAFGTSEISSEDSELYEYLSQKTSTLERSILVTVTSKDESTNVANKSYYKIIQPGFSDSRKAPSISLTPIVYSNGLELSNSIDNGVMANQFQYFVDVDIKNFDKTSWNKVENPKLDLVFALDKVDLEKSKFAERRTEITNFRIYDPKYLNAFENNAFKLKIGYIKDDVSISEKISHIESLVENVQFRLLDVLGNEMKTTSVRIGEDDYSSDWIYLNDKEFAEYNILLANDEFVVNDIPLDSKKHKIRVFFEFANPIPAELNFNFALKRSIVHYAVDGEEKYFTKNEFAEESQNFGQYTKYNFSSGHNKFVINPLSFTVANSETEDLAGMIHKPALKKCAGSVKEVELSLNLFDQEFLKTRANNQTEYDILTKDYNFNDYFVKVSDFQDNVKQIYLNTKDLKDSSYIGLFDESNDFIKVKTLVNSEKAKALGLESFIDDERVNKFDPMSYLSLVYNSNVLIPRTEGNILKINYNEKDYDASNYMQFAQLAPVFLNEQFNLEIRSDDELSAISGWNYEYEASKLYDKDLTIGGSISISGNGYLNLPENYHGLYSEEDIMPLERLIEEQSQEVFGNGPFQDSIQPSSISNDYIPTEGNYWRVPIWNLDWMVPVYKYDQVNRRNYIVPYRFVNPYTMFLDAIVTDQLVKGNDYDEIVSNLGIVTGSYKMSQYIESFLNTDGNPIVINAKYNNQYCIKLLEVLLKTNYSVDMITDYDVETIVEDILMTDEALEKEVEKYKKAIDVPDNVIRWWFCSNALLEAIQNPDKYDTNLSNSQYWTFRKELLSISYESEDVVQKSELKFNIEEYQKYSVKEGGFESINSFVPYNMAYSVYPRIAYPANKTHTNILMVQQPTITSPMEYKLSKHYFKTTEYSNVFPDLPEPYQCLL